MASSESVLGKATILRWDPNRTGYINFGEVYLIESIVYEDEFVECTDLSEPLIRPTYPTPDMDNAYRKYRPALKRPWLLNIGLNFSDYKFVGLSWYYMLQTNMDIQGNQYDFVINIPKNTYGDEYHYEFKGLMKKINVSPPIDDRITVSLAIQTLGKPLFETGHL